MPKLTATYTMQEAAQTLKEYLNYDEVKIVDEGTPFKFSGAQFLEALKVGIRSWDGKPANKIPFIKDFRNALRGGQTDGGDTIGLADAKNIAELVMSVQQKDCSF